MAKVAGIGNLLRQDYERIAPDVLWKLVGDDRPLLLVAEQKNWQQRIRRKTHIGGVSGEVCIALEEAWVGDPDTRRGRGADVLALPADASTERPIVAGVYAAVPSNHCNFLYSLRQSRRLSARS